MYTHRHKTTSMATFALKDGESLRLVAFIFEPKINNSYLNPWSE